MAKDNDDKNVKYGLSGIVPFDPYFCVLSKGVEQVCFLLRRENLLT